MTNSIRELTEKIYKEGVEKADKEAELIIAAAKKESGEILAAARLEKNRMIELASIESTELQKKTYAEIRLAAQKLMSNLKLQVSNLLVSLQVDSFTKEAFEDEKFVKEMMLFVIQNWSSGSVEKTDLNLLIPESEGERLTAFFNEKLVNQLNKGVELIIDPNSKNGFKIGPKDGHYIISFSEKDFENYFKFYLKEKTRELIFGTQQSN